MAGPSTPAVTAALDVGRAQGLEATAPLLLQETNHTVLWLRPDPVVAKVATRASAAEGLQREHQVGQALWARGAPVAGPLAGTAPCRHRPTGFWVTLWERVDHDPAARPGASAVARTLRDVHDALAACELDLPDFRVGLHRARDVLFDDDAMALPRADLAVLRRAYDALLPRVDALRSPGHPLHGEPHDGNLLVGSAGLRWIDFESTCRGPLEWDLAFLSREARTQFGEADEELLALLGTINSARVATWCATTRAARFPDMQRHARHHLRIVRTRQG